VYAITTGNASYISYISLGTCIQQCVRTNWLFQHNDFSKLLYCGIFFNCKLNSIIDTQTHIGQMIQELSSNYCVGWVNG